VRGISQVHLRLREAASLGFKQCLIPRNSLPKAEPENLEILAVHSVQEAFEILFG
jgi:predicted ATP-dependent serine protease